MINGVPDAGTAGTYTVSVTVVINVDFPVGPTTIPIDLPGYDIVYILEVNATSTCPPPAADFSVSNNGLTATFTDGSTTSGSGNYWWTFGDIIGVSLDQNPTYTYLVAGSYTACLWVTDTCGVDSNCQTVTVATVGISDIHRSGLEIFPNPTNGFLTVKGLTGKALVYDIYGRLVKIMEGPSLDLIDFSNGIYFIRLSDEQGRVLTAKVVKE